MGIAKKRKDLQGLIFFEHPLYEKLIINDNFAAGF